jgi:hypothetical protein
LLACQKWQELEIELAPVKRKWWELEDAREDEVEEARKRQRGE